MLREIDRQGTSGLKWIQKFLGLIYVNQNLYDHGFKFHLRQDFFFFKIWSLNVSFILRVTVRERGWAPCSFMLVSTFSLLVNTALEECKWVCIWVILQHTHSWYRLGKKNNKKNGLNVPSDDNNMSKYILVGEMLHQKSLQDCSKKLVYLGTLLTEFPPKIFENTLIFECSGICNHPSCLEPR